MVGTGTRGCGAAGFARALAGLVMAAAACTSKTPSTGIIVELSTDFAVPDELSRVDVTVTSGGATILDRRLDLGTGAGRTSLPASLGLVPADDGDKSFTVQAKGYASGVMVVERRATLPFLRGSVRLLRLALLTECKNATCDPSLTCVPGMGCASPNVNPATLPKANDAFDAATQRPDAFGDARDLGSDQADGGDAPSDPGLPDSPEADAAHDVPVEEVGGADGTGGMDGGGGTDAPEDVPAEAPLGGLGAPCAAPGACTTTFCVDGVCCATATCGTCQTCNGASPGTCAATISGGADLDTCPSGKCWDGACCGGCWDGAACLAGTVDSSCGGAGATCAVCGACRDCVSGACLVVTNAEDPGSCAGANICDASGTCKAKGGTPCSTGATCPSGYCVDGVCCDASSCGVCQRCDGATPGTCTAVGDGSLDADSCASGRCYAGACCAGCWTGSACATGTVDATCGAAGNSCAACGTCRTCSAGACATVTNADDSDTCTGATTCNASGACKQKDGQTCSVTGDCATGTCVDGACCTLAACGTCQTCNGSSPGTCANVAMGLPDPGTCNSPGMCDGTGTCVTPPPDLPPDAAPDLPPDLPPDTPPPTAHCSANTGRSCTGAEVAPCGTCSAGSQSPSAACTDDTGCTAMCMGAAAGSACSAGSCLRCSSSLGSACSTNGSTAECGKCNFAASNAGSFCSGGGCNGTIYYCGTAGSTKGTRSCGTSGGGGGSAPCGACSAGSQNAGTACTDNATCTSMCMGAAAGNACSGGNCLRCSGLVGSTCTTNGSSAECGKCNFASSNAGSFCSGSGCNGTIYYCGSAPSLRAAGTAGGGAGTNPCGVCSFAGTYNTASPACTSDAACAASGGTEVSGCGTTVSGVSGPDVCPDGQHSQMQLSMAAGVDYFVYLDAGTSTANGTYRLQVYPEPTITTAMCGTSGTPFPYAKVDAVAIGTANLFSNQVTANTTMTGTACFASGPASSRDKVFLWVPRETGTATIAFCPKGGATANWMGTPYITIKKGTGTTCVSTQSTGRFCGTQAGGTSILSGCQFTNPFMQRSLPVMGGDPVWITVEGGTNENATFELAIQYSGTQLTGTGRDCSASWYAGTTNYAGTNELIAATFISGNSSAAKAFVGNTSTQSTTGNSTATCPTNGNEHIFHLRGAATAAVVNISLCASSVVWDSTLWATSGACGLGGGPAGTCVANVHGSPVGPTCTAGALGTCTSYGCTGGTCTSGAQGSCTAPSCTAGGFGTCTSYGCTGGTCTANAEGTCM